MLSPKRVKYRKPHKGRVRGFASRSDSVDFGEFGLQVLEAGRITARQIEASRIAISRYIKRGGKVWIRIFPDHAVTKKAAETRMGSGKGNPEYWVSKVQPGTVLFEINGVTKELANEAFRLAGHKLPLKTRIIERD